MNSTQNEPSPVVKPHSRETLKKTLLRLFLIGSACFAFLAPFLTSASIFSFKTILQGFSQRSEASTLQLNSQNLPLLAPATNIDPNPAVGGGDIAVVEGQALLAQEGPSGTAADIEHTRPQSTQISVYTVHEGDTLSGIAQMFDVSVNTIMWANDLENGTIRQGQTLVILPITGVRYQVKDGDTIASIAKKYEADSTEVAQYNDLSVSSSLAVGTTIIIPDGEIAAPAPTRSSTPSSSPTPRISSTTAPSGYYAWPVNGGVVTQGLHGYNGIDIGAPAGTSIYAAAAGTVIIANNGGWNGGYGSYVVIQHGNGTQTLYAHASTIYVSSGQRVGQGEVIAAVGATGKSTGNHLHFETRGTSNPFR